MHLFLEKALKNPAADGSRDTRFSRRTLFAGAAAAAGSATVSQAMARENLGTGHVRASEDGRVESRLLFFEDPLQHQQAAYRVLRNLHDEADVLFWYHFTMFAVVLGARPEPVVRWEGIEFSHHRKLQHGVYRLHGHNLSFPRDLSHGKFIDTVMNPVTEKTVEVPPMALVEDPGYLNTLEGVISLDNPTAPPRTRLEQFLVEDDLIKVEQIRLPPASWPATFVETSVNWSPRDLFDDPGELSLPAGTAGGYVFPWPAWMAMGDQEGHMFATWHGRKLESIDQLPIDFLERAEKAHPELLAVDRTPFEQPLPPPLAGRFDGGS